MVRAQGFPQTVSLSSAPGLHLAEADEAPWGSVDSHQPLSRS